MGQSSTAELLLKSHHLRWCFATCDIFHPRLGIRSFMMRLEKQPRSLLSVAKSLSSKSTWLCLPELCVASASLAEAQHSLNPSCWSHNLLHNSVLLGLHFTNSHCCQRGPEEDFFQPGLAHNELLGCSCCNFVRNSSPWWRQWLADSQLQSSGQRARFASLSSGKVRGLPPRAPRSPVPLGNKRKPHLWTRPEQAAAIPPCLQPVLLCFPKVEHCGGGVERPTHFR